MAEGERSVRHFKGTLETLDGARSVALLEIDESALTLYAGDERLGIWDFDRVDVARTARDRNSTRLNSSH